MDSFAHCNAYICHKRATRLLCVDVVKPGTGKDHLEFPYCIEHLDFFKRVFTDNPSFSHVHVEYVDA